MDTSFFSPGPITWAAIMAFVLFIVGLVKIGDWIGSKMKAREVAAVSPLTTDMAAVKIQLASQSEQLNAFKVEVARTYVTGDIITHLERRIDDMVTSVRDEMRETPCCRRSWIDRLGS